MKHIIAFDPGLTTGVAEYRWGRIICYEVPSEDLTMIYNVLESTDRDHVTVAYEDFKHRPGLMKAELYSVQVIGVTRLWCRQNDIEPFYWLPSVCKAYWTDDKIKKLGLWKPTKDGHAMDALRVLLKYRMETDPEWFTQTLLRLKSRVETTWL